eukprot:CFRG5564T1
MTKQCWICFDVDGEDDGRDYGPVDAETRRFFCTWVSPCKCSGASRWVHQGCIQRWIDEKQQGLTYSTVKCPQCKEMYQIHIPKPNLVWRLYERLDWFNTEISPFMSLGFLTAGLYAACASYGAFAICQMWGLPAGHRLIQRMPPVVFFTVVPLIPFTLIAPRLYSPDALTSILTVSRNTVTGRRLPGGGVEYVEDEDMWEDEAGNEGEGVEEGSDDQENHEINVSGPLNGDDIVHESLIQIDLDIGGAVFGQEGTNGANVIPFTRVLAGGLMLPVISSYVGNILFLNRLDSTKIQRSLLGGFVYLTVRQCMKKLYALSLESRLRGRRVLDMPKSDDYIREGGKS